MWVSSKFLNVLSNLFGPWRSRSETRLSISEGLPWASYFSSAPVSPTVPFISTRVQPTDVQTCPQMSASVLSRDKFFPGP